MKKSIIYKLMLAGTLFGGAGLTSCVDDGLTDHSSDLESIYQVEKDEHVLGLVLSLNQLQGGGTRSQLGDLADLASGSGQGLKDIEEYVNTDNLYILFFNLDGTYLFQIDKPVAVPIGQSENGNDCQWFVRIPVKEINPNLIKYIEENPFKIAVLANWSFDSDLNLGGNLSGWEEFKFNEPLDSEGNLKYDKFGKLEGDHISLLAHAQRDNVYESSELKGGYDHLVYRKDANDYPHMGPYTEWVANYHKTIDEAEDDIRKYFNVKENYYQNDKGFFYDENGNLTALDHFDTKYNNIWHVWNFGGDDVSNFDFKMLDEGIKSAWIDLNKTAKDKFMEDYYTYFSSFTTNYLTIANNLYDLPHVAKPVPPVYPGPGSNYSNILKLSWKMENYSDLDLVMSNYMYGSSGYYGYYPAIIPNYQYQMPEMSEEEQIEILKNFYIEVLEEMLKDKDFSDKYSEIIGENLRNLSDEEFEDMLDKLRSSLYYDEENYLKFMDILETIGLKYYKEYCKHFNGFVIRWPNISDSDNSTGNPLNLDGYPSDDYNGSESWGPGYPTSSPTYIHFKAHADGYARVKYKSHGGAKLYAHVGLNNTPENNASNYQRDNKTNRYIVNEDGYFVKSEGGEKQICDIPFDAKDVYLYMVVDPNYKDPDNTEYERDEDGNIIPGEDGVPTTKVPEPPMIEIFGIEYIESRHLYDVDRRAVLPSKEYPIPMYGVQDFDPIGEYWEPGVLFNLSQFNNAQKQGYNYRRVSLLRSIARVEVKLSKSVFKQKPAHVYLRSMNRSARITPVDFFTPTDIIWKGFNSSSPDDVRRLQNYIDVGNLEEQRIIQTTPGVVQEEKNIMQYGPFYIGSNTQQSGNKLNEYRRTTAWPFGIWEHQWGWDWNRGNGVVEDFDTYQVGNVRAYTGQQVPEYPRILHTRISRSDYSHFAEVEDNNYWHYIIYIPEKNITDADEPGDISDRPKICHVEIRFNGGPESNFGQSDENGNLKDEENIVDNFDDKRAYRLYFTTGGRASLGSFNWEGRDSWDAYEYDWNIVKQHWPILRNHVYTFTVDGGSLDQVGSVNVTVDAPDIRGSYYEFY